MCNNKKSGPGRSDRKGLGIIELINMFPDEKSARKWLEDIRWPNGKRHCPHCGSLETAVVKSGKPMPYHCGDCRKYFSVRVGTVMQSANVPLRKWVIAMYLMSTSLKGVSSMKLHRDLGVTQKTAWLMSQKIREGWSGDNGKLEGTVEVDETYIGGKERNKHDNSKSRLGRGPVGKIAVIGAKQRSGDVTAKSISTTNSLTMQNFIGENVKKGAQVFTDDHRGYLGMTSFYKHKQVKHSAKEYVKGDVHTNGIESFWSLFKRGYYGTYHHMSPKHLNRYVKEFCGRHNSRSFDTIDQMSAIVTGMCNKTMTYKELIK